MVNRGYVGTESRKAQADILVSIDTAIKDANDRLNAVGKSKALIDRKGKKLYLRGTLPLTPEDGTEGTKRYWLPFGDANLESLSQAERKCREIDSYIRNGGSEWWLLLPGYQEKKIEKSKPKTLAILKQEFTNSYWLNRPKNRKSLATWEKSYQDIFKKLPDDELISDVNIAKWLASTQPDSKPRQDLLRIIKCLCEQAGVKDEIDWRKYKCKYKPQKRVLPSDGWIEATFDNMPKDVGWAFGLIATYGLRPSEMFQLTNQCIEKFINPSNKRNILYIPDDTKTGEREVYPLHPTWVERFDLLNVKRLQTEAKKLETKISWLNKLFHKYGFNQPAYDLRHRYAIRASELEVLVDIAAKWMGHSVEEHCRTYQKWMDATTHNKAFDKVLEQNKELTEIEKLKLENQFLREENKKLRALLSVQSKATIE